MVTTSWATTLRGALNAGRFGVTACRKTHLALSRGSIEGVGHLIIGCQWDGGIHVPTQLVVRNAAKCILNGEFRIYSGSTIWINQGARLSLGNGYINNFARISCFRSITIGEGAMIAENVTMRDSDDHEILGRTPGPQPIEIGDHVWIGMNSTILKGVRIGNGAVIAAGAVVNRDVPENTLAAGVPARVVKEIEWR